MMIRSTLHAARIQSALCTAMIRLKYFWQLPPPCNCAPQTRSDWVLHCGHATGADRQHSALAAQPPHVAAAVGGATPLQPGVPLCQRPAVHYVDLYDLLAWHKAALQHVKAVGDSWVQQNDGPTAEDLITELSWLLDDAVAGEYGSGDFAARGVTWRALDKHPAKEEPGVHQVLLREPLQALDAMWARRLADRVPLQYLTSTAYWRDMVLSVGPGVLIPRPETELMIDYVLEAVAAREELGQGQWADLGTGSGALAVGVARALPAAPAVWAVDLSPAPVACAAFNAQRLSVAERVRVVQGSWYDPLIGAGVVRLAGVVSNPPYIASPQVAGLQAEVGRHEPHLALDGGEGLGIDCLMPICIGAMRLLQPGGFLALETAGGEQGDYVADVLRRMRGPGGSSTADPGALGGAGDETRAFEDVRVRRDMRGVGRFVTATRAAERRSA